MPGRYGYDLSDDLKMLKSLYDRLIQNDPDALKPCGLKIWRSIIHEDGRFKRHSAQALATRMRRFVLPNLQKLCQRLTGEIEAKLIKSYKFYIDENRKSQKFNVIDEQEEDENDTDESCKLTDDESNEPYIINNPQQKERKKLGRAIIAGIPKLKSTSEQRFRRIIWSEDDEATTTKTMCKKGVKNQQNESTDAVVDFLPDNCSPNNENKRDVSGEKKKENSRKRKLFVEDENFLTTPRPNVVDEDGDEDDEDELNISTNSAASNRDYLNRLRSCTNVKKVETEKSNSEKQTEKAAADCANGSLGTSGSQIGPDQNDINSQKKSSSTNTSSMKIATENENQAISPKISQNQETENRTIIKFLDQNCQTSPEKLFVRKFNYEEQQKDVMASPKKIQQKSEMLDHSCQTSPEKSTVDDNTIEGGKQSEFAIYGLSAERIEQICTENCSQTEKTLEEILIKMHLIDKMCKKFNLDRSAVLKLFNFLDWQLVTKKFECKK